MLLEKRSRWRVFLWRLLGAWAVFFWGAAAAARPGPWLRVSAAAATPSSQPTARGPLGVMVPMGSCPIVVRGRVWVLPCVAARRPRIRRQHRLPLRLSRTLLLGVAVSVVGGWWMVRGRWMRVR